MGPQSLHRLSQGCASNLPELRVHPSAVTPESYHSDGVVQIPFTRKKESSFCPSISDKPPSYVLHAPGNEQATIAVFHTPLKAHVDCEHENVSHLPSPVSPQSDENFQSQWCYSSSELPYQRSKPTSLRRVVCSCCSADLYICGPCQQRFPNRSPLGKRIALVARRTLSKLGIRRKSARFRSTSPARSVVSDQLLVSTAPEELEGHQRFELEAAAYHRPGPDYAMSCELPAAVKIAGLRAHPAELSSDIWGLEEPVSALEYSGQTFSPVSAISTSRTDTPFPSLLETPTSSIYSPTCDSSSQEPQGQLVRVSTKLTKLDDQLLLGYPNRLNDIRQFSESIQDFAFEPVSDVSVADLPIRFHPARDGFPPSPTSTFDQIAAEEVTFERGAITADEEMTTISDAGMSKEPMTAASQEHCPVQGVSSSDLSEVLNSQSGKMEGRAPAELVLQLKSAYQLTIEGSRQTLDRLYPPDSRAADNNVDEICLTVDTGLAVLEKLVAGKVLTGLHEILPLLVMSYSIIAMLVDEQDREQFVDALSLHEREWMCVIPAAEHQRLEVLLRHLKLPRGSDHRLPYVHEQSNQALSPSRLATSLKFLEPAALESDLLTGETQAQFRVRTGLHAQICKWFIDYLNTAGSSLCRTESLSLNVMNNNMPPPFEDAVQCYVLDICKDYAGPSFLDRHPVLSSLEYELGEGLIATFLDVAEMLSNPASISEGQEGLDRSIMHGLCRGAEAMYESSKVCWVTGLLRQTSDPPIPSVETGGMSTPSPLPPDLTKASVKATSDKGKGVLSQLSTPAIAFSTHPGPTSCIKKRKRTDSTGEPSSKPKRVVPTPTPCPHCGTTFRGTVTDQKQNLRRHINTMHPDVLGGHKYPCPYCAKPFPRPDYCAKHMKDCNALTLHVGMSFSKTDI